MTTPKGKTPQGPAKSPLDLELEAFQKQVTLGDWPAVKTYLGRLPATEGKAAYQQYCAACHLEDGTGRIGSNLVDNQYNHSRVNTDAGMFEVIYAGGTGAMQPFAGRITNDSILKIMAFIDSMRKK